jgi:NAD(P)H-hydrate epimerase
MKVFDTRQIREIDEFTIRHEPVSSTELMERAAVGCVTWISGHVPPRASIRIFAGPGNNGGDGWAIARLLADQHYQHIEVYLLQISGILSADSQYNRGKLIDQGLVPVKEISTEADFPVLGQEDIIIDALYGSGLSRPLEGLPLQLVKHINASNGRVVAIDIPSGLLGEDNHGIPEEGIIRAAVTLSFEFPKRAFFYAENEKYTGRWYIIPIGLHPEIIRNSPANFYYLTFEDVQGFVKTRNRFTHKGTYGHALLIAGQYGMTGAAILSAKACLRSGVGLLTTHVPSGCYPIVQGAVPESIFSLDASDAVFSFLPALGGFAAVGAGPGMGKSPTTAKAFQSLLENCKVPLVLDADALNLLASQPEWIGLLPANTILTPHPGEFDRLAGASPDGLTRNKRQIEFAVKHHLILLLKGANTAIALPDGRCYFNSTGNPGMATAGSGDVLTGVILSLLAQGYSPEEAALAGCYVHGLAGDMAMQQFGQHALIASDIVAFLNTAFKKFEDHGNSFD